MLRDEGREINHHGRIRKFDADGNEIDEDEEVSLLLKVNSLLITYFSSEEAASDAVEPIKIMDDGNGGFDLNLISRQEDTQVTSSQKYKY